MLKNKMLTVVISGAVLIGGASLAFADTNNKIDENQNSFNGILPISQEVDNDAQPVKLKTKFTDIENHWAYDEITSLEVKKFWGELDNEFDPSQTISEAEFINYLDKVFEFEKDVEFDFNNSEEITRIEVAKAIQDAFKIKNLTVISTLVFPIYEDTQELDVSETSALSFVFNTGIMKGKTKDYFHPHTPITRAEVAVVLHRTLATLEYAEPIYELE